MDNNIMERTPEVIAGEINAIKSQTSGILEAALGYARRSCFEIGKRLEEAKALVPHGAWGDWLRENVAYSESTASNLMRIWREFGNEQIDFTGRSDAEVFGDLSQSQLVELFALPPADRRSFAEGNRALLVGDNAVSIRELRDRIKALTEQHEKDTLAMEEHDRSYADMADRLREAQADAKAAIDKANKEAIETVDYGKVVAERDDARQRVAELEAREPEVQQVTVIRNEPTEEQIAEIRRKAIAEVEEAHKSQLEQLEADLRTEAETGKAEAAEHFTAALKRQQDKMAEAEAKAQAEIKRLRAQANVHAQRINYCLSDINRLMSEIDSVIREADGQETGSGGRLRRQVEAMLGKMIDGRGWNV